MRLWPFRRRAAADTNNLTVAASPAPLPERPERPRDEWRRLAPLTRTSGPPPLVAPRSRIAAGLAATADTGMVLAPLGHERRHDAPIGVIGVAGVIGGAIVPTARPSGTDARADGPPLDLARAASRPATAVPTLRWPEWNDAPAPAATAVTSMEMSRTDTADPRSDDTKRAPLRPAPATAQPAHAPRAVPERPAERPPSLPPAMPARRLAGQLREMSTQTSERTIGADRPEALPLRQAPVSPTIGATNSSSSPSVTGTQPASSSTQTSGDTGEPDVEPSDQRPLAGSRTIHRRRLGEPLAHRPASMVAAPSVSRDLPPRPNATASNEPALPPEPVTPAMTAPARPAPARRDSLPVPLARRAAAVPAGEPDPASAADPPHDESSARPAAPLIGGRDPLSIQRPRVADRPAGPSGGPLPVSVVQREHNDPPVAPISRTPSRRSKVDQAKVSEAEAEVDRAEPAPEAVPADLRAQLEPMLGVDLSDVPVHRGPASDRAASEMRARAFTVGSEVHLPGKLGPTSHGEARSTLAHELTHVAQQRRLGAVAPNEDSPAGEAMEAEARSVARRIDGPQRVSVAPPVQRRPTVPMVHTVAPSVREPAAASSSLSPSEARSVVAEIEHAALSGGMADRIGPGGVSFAGSTPTAASSIGAQREPEGSGTTSNARPVTEIAAAAPTTDPVDALSPERLDELAARLYEPIRSRLRHDLLLQRERAGALFDHR